MHQGAWDQKIHAVMSFLKYDNVSSHIHSLSKSHSLKTKRRTKKHTTQIEQ